MNTQRMACCYYPTSLLIIDDDPLFLTNLKLCFGRDVAARTFHNPREALTYLHSAYKSQFVMDQHLVNTSDIDIVRERSFHSTTDINVAAIKEQLYNPHRYRDHAVLIIDYAMPSMTGIDFCRELKGIPIKKILMTGEADNSVAVNAFNEGIIDQFIMKNRPDFLEHLLTIYKQLERQYFQDLSEIIIKNIGANRNNCMNNPQFIHFFNRTCEQHDIREYYLVDDIGSFIMLDNQGHTLLLIVKTDKELQGYYEILRDSEAPQDLQQQVYCRKQTPFFLSETDLNVSTDQWKRFMHPIKPIPGMTDQYYALVTDTSRYALNTSNILSYEEYLDIA